MNNRIMVILTILFMMNSSFLFADNYHKQEMLNAQDMSKSDAINIGKNYVKFKSKYENIKWKNAYHFIEYDIRDIKGNLRGYHLSIFDKNNLPLGYVVVPNKNGFGVVSKFNDEGKSYCDFIYSRFETHWKPILKSKGLKIISKKLIGNEQGFFALAVKTDKPNEQIDGATNYQGYQIFTLNPVKDITQILSAENREIYKTYVNTTNNFDENEEAKARKSLSKSMLIY